MRKRLYMAAFLLVPLLLGAGVLLEHSHVTMGKQVAFTGLDLKNAPTALPGAGATKCVNYMFDKNASLHVRKGLDQWNTVTYPAGIEFLYSYVTPGLTGYYLISNGDSSWFVPDYETDFAQYRVTDWVISQGVVDAYSGSPFLHVGVTDSNHDWRKLLGAGVDLSVTIGSRASEYRIVSVYEDTLIKLDSTLFDADDSTYTISAQNYQINDASVANGQLYIGTTNGLFWYDANDIYYGDTLSYTGFTSGSGFPIYTEIGINLGLSWQIDSELGDGAIANCGSDQVIYVSVSPTVMDTATQVEETRSLYFTMQYPVTWCLVALNVIKTWGAGIRPDPSSTSEITTYKVAIDSSTAITFKVDSIHVETVAIGSDSAFLNVFFPADSTWDSTRFETGDWILTAPTCDTCGTPYRVTDYFSIPGLLWLEDTDSGFYACDGPYSSTVADTFTVVAMRRPKATSESGNYLCLAVYKDRLFTVRSDAPDFLRYSPAFYPDSVDAYQVIGLDITNGDRIERMAVLYDNLYIFTRNTIHQLSGDPSSPSATLGRLFDGVGISAPKTFVVFEGRMLLCHQTGFYLFDGSRPQLISAAILPIIADSINWTAAGDVMCAGYYDRHLWVSYPSGASSSNNRTLVYNVDDGRWGNVSFVAGAYHKITNPSDTNKFLVGDADTGAVYVYKGHDDDGTAIQATYETGWSDFGSEVEKQIQGFHVVFDKSAACSLSINLYRNDTIVATTIIDTLTYSQSFLDKHKNVYDLDAIGRLFKVGIDMNSSAGEGWVSELTLEVVEAGEKRYDR